MRQVFIVLHLILSLCIAKAQTGVVNKNSKGVVVYKSDPGNRTVIIYKRDGTPLRSLKINDFLSEDALISPFALSGEYNLLVFDCIGITPSHYVIVANSDTGLIGYIKRTEPFFNFETWPQHITHFAAVDFNEVLNPLRRLPNAKSSTVKFDSAEVYSPRIVKGNWVKVAWGYPKESVGWIKWWDSERKLLVGVYYVM